MKSFCAKLSFTTHPPTHTQIHTSILKHASILKLDKLGFLGCCILPVQLQCVNQEFQTQAVWFNLRKSGRNWNLSGSARRKTDGFLDVNTWKNVSCLQYLGLRNLLKMNGHRSVILYFHKKMFYLLNFSFLFRFDMKLHC